jgi:predicted RNA methylase
VPHRAIVPYLLHYTSPGDVVLDGFAGSGMTGLAAQWCGFASSSQRAAIEATFRAASRQDPIWGARTAILNDLGPAATFMSANYLAPFDIGEFAEAGKTILNELDNELGWMYETGHTDGRRGRVEYTVWSAIYGCPHCGGDINFVEEALDTDTKRTRDSFPCPRCGAVLTKRLLDKRFESTLDSETGSTREVPRRLPTLIRYRIGREVFEKTPDADDLATLSRVASLPLPIEVPQVSIPHMHMTHERARMDQAGVTRVSHFYLPRAANSLGQLWRKASAQSDVRLRHMLLFFVEQAIWTMSILNRYRPTGYSQVNQQLGGVYYVPAQISEPSPRYVLDGKLDRLVDAFRDAGSTRGPFAVSTGDCAHLSVPDRSVDYIFTDPPFGENIYYADLNFLVESWHRVATNATPEAIIDQAKAKKLVDYQALMEGCFREYARVLKPGRWMTVVFHNSSNAVWNAIQESIQRAGFVVADVRTMDKQQASYRQVTSMAVKQDLVISAYKPRAGFEQRFALAAGTEQGAWDVVREHLEQLPVFVEHAGRVEVVAERQGYLLFDRMVAFHIQRGTTVPLSAGPFYEGLRQRFLERDDMYFTELQAAQYDSRRLASQGIEQLSIIVLDEKSAIQWIRTQLAAQSQTFQDLQPKFLRELNQNRFEQLPELRDILEQNFLEDPNTHRWRVPDPGKQADLEALRQRALLNEFATYLPGTTKLKRFRLEAIRAGFSDLWAKRAYTSIIKLAERLPDEVVQEDAAILMYYDNAVTREGKA